MPPRRPPNNHDRPDPQREPPPLQTRPARDWRKIEQIVNTGALNGGIFLVQDRATGEKCIEKVADRRLIAGGHAEQEIRILRYLGHPAHGPHPHITHMVDYFIDKRNMKASIFLEYCTMKGLDSVIKNRIQYGQLFSEMDVWEWFIQLFDALTFCHYGPDPSHYARGGDNKWNTIFHRDIKTENILVTEGQRPGQRTSVMMKLADFGLSLARVHIANKRQNHNDRNVSSGGTREWNPPEAPRYYARSDVWQMGAVMGCICNLVFIPRDFDWETPAPGYSEYLNGTIRDCLRFDHIARPKADEVLAQAIKRYEKMKEEIQNTGMNYPNPYILTDIRQLRQQGRGQQHQMPHNDPGFGRHGHGPERFEDMRGFNGPRFNQQPPLAPDFGHPRGFNQGMPRRHTMGHMGGQGVGHLPRAPAFGHGGMRPGLGMAPIYEEPDEFHDPRMGFPYGVDPMTGLPWSDPPPRHPQWGRRF